jgi:glycosyltransferase involved in cell wall biosynthesis
MKIAIDGRVFMKPGSGIVHYSFELVQHLITHDKKNRYSIYIPKDSNYNKINFKGRYNLILVALPKILWKTKLFTNILEQQGEDIYFSTNPTAPYVPANKRKVAIVTTSHGIIPNNLWPNLRERLYWTYHQPKVVQYSDHIICVSNDTKVAINKAYNKPIEKISVGYFGVSNKMRPLNKKQKAKAMEYLSKKYNIPKGEFAFQVAGTQGYKNVVTILKAQRLLKAKHNLDIPIVIARINNNTIRELLDPYGIKTIDDVIGNTFAIPWIDFQDIPLFYACARMNIYSSLFEGVGFPIGEAMACGSAVITTNISAMPECAGGAALLINNPLNANEWANKICDLYHDKKLQKKLIRLGVGRAKDFTWQKVAEKVSESFDKAYTLKKIRDSEIIQ